MGCQVTLTGKIVVGGEGCGCSGGSAPSKQAPLSLDCSGRTYGAVVSSDCPQLLHTIGVLGAYWQELVQGQLGNFQLLYFRSRTVPVKLRIGAAPASLAGSGATWPVVFAGGESVAFAIDGVSVPVTFTAGSRSAAQVATLINQAAVGAGLSFLPATVDNSGQLRITGLATGEQGTVTVATALAAIGFASTTDRAVGAGNDLIVNGSCLLQFDEGSAPSRIQMSGHGWIEYLAAGAAIT